MEARVGAVPHRRSLQAVRRRAGDPAVRSDHARALLKARVFLALIAFYAVAALFTAVLGVVVPDQWGRGTLATMTPAVARVAVGALLACAVWARAGWSSWNQMGWPGPKAGFAGFGLGLGVGLGMAAAAVVLELLVGQARLTVTPVSASAYLAASAPVAGMLAIAALAEELLFRGFPLSHLARALGPVRAALALAIGFAALHAFNPGVTPLGLINIGVASLALSAIFFRLGGLPAAWGAHLGWNGGLALGADAPVSGIAFHLPAVDYSAAGPNWITGGSFGPEGGLVATTVMGAVAVWLGKGISKATGG